MDKKNKCTLCGCELRGQYVSPRIGVKHCMDCYSGKTPKSLVWWISVGLVEAFVIMTIFSIFSIVFSSFL